MNKAEGKDNIYGCQYGVKHFPLHELQGPHLKTNKKKKTTKYYFEQLVINELGIYVLVIESSFRLPLYGK